MTPYYHQHQRADLVHQHLWSLNFDWWDGHIGHITDWRAVVETLVSVLINEVLEQNVILQEAGSTDDVCVQASVILVLDIDFVEAILYEYIQDIEC